MAGLHLPHAPLSNSGTGGTEPPTSEITSNAPVWFLCDGRTFSKFSRRFSLNSIRTFVWNRLLNLDWHHIETYALKILEMATGAPKCHIHTQKCSRSWYILLMYITSKKAHINHLMHRTSGLIDSLWTYQECDTRFPQTRWCLKAIRPLSFSLNFPDWINWII